MRLPQGLPAAAVTAIQQSVGAANVVAGQLPGPLGPAVRATAHAAFMSGMDEAVVFSTAISLQAAALILAFLPSRKTAARESPQPVSLPAPTP